MLPPIKSPRVSLVVIVFSLLIATAQTASAQYTWNNALGGEWFDANNWAPSGGPPNAIGATAIFGNVVINPAIITISGGSVTVGELNMRGTSLAWGYSIGLPGNTITLNNGGGMGTLSTDAGIVSGNTSKIVANLSVAGAFAANMQSGTVQVDGTITGNSGMTKSGAGTLILRSSNSGLTGGITVNGGTLEVRGSNSLSISGMGANAVTVNSGGQLMVTATSFWEPTNALTIAGNGPSGASLYQDAALWFKGSADHYLGPITLTADASLRLDGAFLFRGSTNVLTLNGHEARFTGAGSSSTVGEVDGVITDGPTPGGRVVIDINGGNIKLAANNTYTGTTVVNKGTLFIDRPASLGQALGTPANGVTVNSGGTLDMGGTYTVANKLLTMNGGSILCNGGTKTWTGAVTLNANAIIGANGPDGNFTFTGGININDKTLTLLPYFNNSVITINTSPISGTGGVSITPVTGQGIVNFNVTNLYSGPTVLNAHRLFANATNATGSGPVTIGGGSLRGVGSIAGLVTANSGSIAPGSLATPGHLALNGGVTFTSVSQLRVRLVSNTSFDVLDVTGTALLGNAGVVLDLTGATSNFNVGTDKLYILKMAAGQSLPGGTTFSAQEGAAVGSSSLYTFHLHYDYTAGGGVYLIPQPVPEPAFLLALAAGGLGVARLRRRNRA